MAIAMTDYSEYDFEGRAHVEKGAIVLDFGKHAGRELGNVPTGYLQWMAEQEFPEDLLTAVEEELETR